MTCALSPVLCDVGLLTRIQLRDADVWVAVIASHVYWGVWGLLQVMLAAALALMPISFRCFRYRPRYAGMMMKCRWTSSCIPTNTRHNIFFSPCYASTGTLMSALARPSACCQRGCTHFSSLRDVWLLPALPRAAFSTRAWMRSRLAVTSGFRIFSTCALEVVLRSPCHAMQCNAIQCNAMQCYQCNAMLSMQCNAMLSMQCNAINAMQCNAMQCYQCNAMQCNAMQCNAMQCNAMQCNAMQCNAINAINAMQCNATQCNAMQCNAMQCNAMQCNAMQCNAKLSMQWNAMQCYQCNAMQSNTIN
jgi:hypothetical protein